MTVKLFKNDTVNQETFAKLPKHYININIGDMLTAVGEHYTLYLNRYYYGHYTGNLEAYKGTELLLGWEPSYRIIEEKVSSKLFKNNGYSFFDDKGNRL